MAAFNKFNSFVLALAHKTHNLGSDSLKTMLSSVAPVATNTQKSNLTEISAGNGYTAGGGTINVSASSQTSGVYKLVGSLAAFTASGGSMASFRYATVYNDTATNKELICWFDYGSSITLAAGESFTVSFDQTNGILQLQ